MWILDHTQTESCRYGRVVPAYQSRSCSELLNTDTRQKNGLVVIMTSEALLIPRMTINKEFQARNFPREQGFHIKIIEDLLDKHLQEANKEIRVISLAQNAMVATAEIIPLVVMIGILSMFS